MAIEANFNKIVYLNKFNNYFNRKILGGSNLRDYFYGQSNQDVQLTLTFRREDLTDFDPGNDCMLKEKIIEIPYSIEASVLTVEINNGIGNLTWDEYWGYDYNPDTRKLSLKFDTTALNLSDIPANIEIVIFIYFRDRIFKIDENINFNPNDDITAEVITNDLFFHPDYLLVLDAEDNIISKWFILHDNRTRSGQYKLQLRRDIISDNLIEILSSPIFVQKGMLKDYDPFIVNSEGMSVNQIKKSETLLKDKSKNAWIIFYIAKNTPITDVLGPLGITVQIQPNIIRNQTKSQEFDMIALPLYDCEVYLPDGTRYGKILGEYSRTIASSIATTLDANCYDVQLLPYCPFVERTEEGKIYIVDYEGNPNPDYSNVEVLPSTAGGSTFTYLYNKDFEINFVSGATHPWRATINLSLLDLKIKYADILSAINLTKVKGPSIFNQTITISNYHEGASIYLEFDTEPTDLIISLESTYEAGGVSLDISYIFYCENATFECELDSSDLPETSLNMKEISNLTMQRFVSPNYQGSFEINLARNGGNFGTIKAYCTYKPYTPYIKIAPEFNFLYGQEFKDCRGLILGGDFSLPRSSSAWQSFQLNNKNYQNIFNREIQNMDFNYNIELRNQVISGSVGIGTSALAGAGAGALAGSIVPGIGTAIGAAVGAIGGAITSGVGMAVDTITMAQKYKETKDLSIDKFNYQLGNIKALPYTLTKVGAFDITSKIWPFLEWYECTETEMLAFAEKIKYESMTVMRIDQMSNYYHEFDELCYFKGELIRNTNIASDNHVLMAIYEELLKGVYI